MPSMQEALVQSLGSEDILEKEMATNSNILARGPWWATVHGVTNQSDKNK